MPTENKRPHTNIPADFPQFIVPGFENEMHNLRELYWTHYERSGPVSTFEDDWLPRPQLWPATAHNDRMHRIRELWKNSLAKKGMDEEGYVFTHQHRSIAHQHGWPFPFWQENYPGTWGCHFNLDDISDGWHGTSVKSQDGFTSHGVEDQGIIDGLWTLRAASPNAWIETPPLYIDPAQCPFLQLRWKADFNENIQPFVQWKTEDENFYGDNRRMYFDPASEDMTFTQIPMHKNIFWNETKKIIQLRICFNNQHAGAKIFISSLFTTFDTRHTVNNAYYIAACSHYFYWTGDFLFLRENINRMRVALRWMMTVCKGLEEKCIVAPFVGHDGRPGYIINGDGSKTVRPAQGIGSNYWDIIPAGYRDAYASIQYFNALHIMGKLENEIKTKPEWNIPGGAIAFDGNELLRHAGEVRAYGTTNFWNPATKRFTTGYDADGMFYDYGFVFMNLEAMYYGFATVEQCGEIISWLDGERVVEGDTSKGDDIYFWRFGPRSTTKRNVEYYAAGWLYPENIPWGYQVQDGGCVLGFSYFDMKARLDTLGADNAWKRLKEILEWYGEVMNEGGPREYYKDGSRGTMQGCGTAGGLGIDLEFFESILVPQIMIHGFLGLNAEANGITINPKLPSAFPSLTVTRIHYKSVVFDASANSKTRVISVTVYEGMTGDINFYTDLKGSWTVEIKKPVVNG